MKKLRYFFTLVILGGLVWIIALLIRNPETIFPFLNPVLMILAGLGVGVFFARKYGGDWSVYGAGAGAFILSQALHIPFNGLALNPWLESLGLDMTIASNLLLFSVALGLSAGLFEETTRYIFYRIWPHLGKDGQTGLMLGAGHGGIEAALLGAITMYTFLQYMIVHSANPEALTLMAGPGNEAVVKSMATSYFATPWYVFLLASLERVFAILFHLGASLLVLKTIKSGNPVFYLGAVLYHTILNAGAVYALRMWGVVASEGYLAATALLSIFVILKLKNTIPTEEVVLPDQAAPLTAETIEIKPVELTAEDLEDSHYD